MSVQLLLQNTGLANKKTIYAESYALPHLGAEVENVSLVTQATSLVTGVTLNSNSGVIKCVKDAGAGGTVTKSTSSQFRLTNNKISANDVVLVSIKETTNLYSAVANNPANFFVISKNVNNGFCDIVLCNPDPANDYKDHDLKISFIVIKSN